MNATQPDGLRTRFPNHWSQIEQLKQNDDDFRELCAHLEECRDVLASLCEEAASNQSRIAEYRSLVFELEQEIQRTVEATA